MARTSFTFSSRGAKLLQNWYLLLLGSAKICPCAALLKQSATNRLSAAFAAARKLAHSRPLSPSLARLSRVCQPVLRVRGGLSSVSIHTQPHICIRLSACLRVRSTLRCSTTHILDFACHILNTRHDRSPLRASKSPANENRLMESRSSILEERRYVESRLGLRMNHVYAESSRKFSKNGGWQVTRPVRKQAGVLLSVFAYITISRLGFCSIFLQHYSRLVYCRILPPPGGRCFLGLPYTTTGEVFFRSTIYHHRRLLSWDAHSLHSRLVYNCSAHTH